MVYVYYSVTSAGSDLRLSALPLQAFVDGLLCFQLGGGAVDLQILPTEIRKALLSISPIIKHGGGGIMQNLGRA